MHELEITSSQIARLVLGYLKAEKCDQAHEEFLKSSRHLRELKGRIITRVDHKSLVDFLNEYAQLNILIQERIEETDFYNEHSSKTSLYDQLIYLLDYRGNIKASTPNRSPIHRRFTSSDVGVNTDFCDEENCEVRATSLEELPGNSQSDNNNSNKKRTEKQEKVSSGAEDEEEEEGPSINLEILTQTLLEHHELHEKLADTINVVRNSSSEIQKDEEEKAESSIDNKNNTASEAVEAAIRTIVQKTTSDPFFDKLVKEVIGEELDDEKCNNYTPTPQETNARAFDGNNLDGYLKFHSNPIPAETSNSLVVNSNNVLMVQTGSTMGTIDISKPCYVINSAPQPIFSTGNVLSEQEIMSMPIVVCDDKQEKQGMNQFIIPANVAQPVAPTYLVNLTTNNELPSTSVQFCHNEQQKKVKTNRDKRKRIVPTSIPRTEPLKILPQPPELPKYIPRTEPIKIQLQEPILIENKKEEEEPKTKITETVTPSDAQINGTTPRSGSHVRALDFSTPQKLYETVKIENKDEKKKETTTTKTSWDADLRGLISSSPEPEKKKPPTPKKKKKKVVNKTVEEGKLIEKALQEDGKKKMRKKKGRKVDSVKKEEVVVDEETNKLVLSPSKLNASKRSLVDSMETPDVADRKTPTPPDVKHVNAVKRNIVIALQTPMKVDICPRTPGFFSPVNNLDTPLTKVLKEQLYGIDLSTIPTPKFPVTPSFPITPSIDPRYSNRPTDYSSSSSYYQPSDTEHNRSIEQLIEECNRLENEPNEIPTEKQIHILNEVRIPPTDNLKAVAEKMREMNKNVIGRKNLKLVEQVEVDSSCSTCSSTSSDSSSEDSDEESKENNETVIAKQTPQRYSLRSASKNLISSTPVVESSSTEVITRIINNVDVKSTLISAKTHDEILLEMEEKRKKTVEKLENDRQKLEEKRRKVVEKKEIKRKPAKKPVVSKRGKTVPKINKQKTKDEETLESFEKVETDLLKNCSTSTPSIPRIKSVEDLETKRPPVNEETEKLVDGLKAILNTNKITDENEQQQLSDESKPSEISSSTKRAEKEIEKQTSEVTLKKPVSSKPETKNADSNSRKSPSKIKIEKTHSKRRLSIKKKLENSKEASTTDDSSSKTEKDVSIDEETEKLLENLHKAKTETDVKETCPLTGKDEVKNTDQIKKEPEVKKSEEPKKDNEFETACDELMDDLKENDASKNTMEKEDNYEKSKLDLKINSDVENETESKEKCLIVETKSDDVVNRSKRKNVSPQKQRKTVKYSDEVSSNREKEKKPKRDEKLSDRKLKVEKSAQVSKASHSCRTKTGDLENKRLAMNEKSQKLFGDFNEDEKNENDVKDLEENSCKEKHEVIGVEYGKLVDNLMEISSDNVNGGSNKTEKNEEIKATNNEQNKKTEELQTTSETNTVSDAENAEKLVSDLKERGIHLIHNKPSPPKPQTDKQESNDPENATQDNSLVEFESEFSVCLFHRENVHYKHDDYIRSNKKLSDYDFSLLDKEMNATVYLAEFDAEVQKVMTCTPFDTLLDIPTKIDVLPKRKPSTKKDVTKIQKPSPLELLNKELSKPQSSNSPLEGLYDEEDDEKPKNSSATVNSDGGGVIVRKKSSKKPEKMAEHGSSKRARSLSNSSHEKKMEEPTRKSSRIKNRRSSEPRPTGSAQMLTAQQEELSVIVSETEFSEVYNREDDAEDELMNYAAVGTPEKCLKKRKADEKPDGHHVEKKIKPEKCKELLEKINVDEFLSHLHGNT